jgi:hypothetical protein
VSSHRNGLALTAAVATCVALPVLVSIVLQQGSTVLGWAAAAGVVAELLILAVLIAKRPGHRRQDGHR